MDKTKLVGSLADLLMRLWFHLSRRRQFQFILLMGLMVVSVLAEVVSLGAVLPFLGILIAPDSLFSHSVIGNIVHVLGINTPDQLLIPLTIAFAAAALIAGAIRILLLWVSTRLAYATGADLSNEVYRRTLYQPYLVHLSRNTSEVISGITNKVNGVTFGVLFQLLIFVSSTLLFVAIMLVLLAIDPYAASLAAIGFGSSYGLITWLSRKRLHLNSHRIAHEQIQVVKALQEGLGGIRDVLLDATQPLYCGIYRKADHTLRLAQGDNTFIGQSPRYFMEALGMVLIAGLAILLSRQDGGVSTALPVLGAIALGAQRLLPALQQIYTAWANIAGQYASLADIIELMDQPLAVDQIQTAPAPLLMQKDIRFEAMCFRYTDYGPLVINDLNLTIPKGARVGFVGSTGSGKSTTLDLLMGLLKPTEGELLVDGQAITDNRLRAWQRSIAHVPQSIYLSDTNIAQNIAFGVPPEAIDIGRVRQAARQAQIAEFIECSPQGYQAHVGERGIRLSGGQRQRIGIARALYKQASILVFDEATSALDNVTEKSVMEAIQGLSSELTILMIAHRITTVQRCDIIVELDQGRLVAHGTYEQLLECSPSFRKMVVVMD
jgi:ABC-type multidrug transport system fused ATPase/permease subunit